MKALQEQILITYNNEDYRLSPAGQNDPKPAIQLIHEIELELARLMNEIKYIEKAHELTDNDREKLKRKDWQGYLEKQEKDRRDYKQKRLKTQKLDEEQEKKMIVQANLEERQMRKVTKLGKQ